MKQSASPAAKACSVLVASFAFLSSHKAPAQPVEAEEASFASSLVSAQELNAEVRANWPEKASRILFAGSEEYAGFTASRMREDKLRAFLDQNPGRTSKDFEALLSERKELNSSPEEGVFKGFSANSGLLFQAESSEAGALNFQYGFLQSNLLNSPSSAWCGSLDMHGVRRLQISQYFDAHQRVALNVIGEASEQENERNKDYKEYRDILSSYSYAALRTVGKLGAEGVHFIKNEIFEQLAMGSSIENGLRLGGDNAYANTLNSGIFAAANEVIREAEDDSKVLKESPRSMGERALRVTDRVAISSEEYAERFKTSNSSIADSTLVGDALQKVDRLTSVRDHADYVYYRGMASWEDMRLSSLNPLNSESNNAKLKEVMRIKCSNAKQHPHPL